MRDISKLLQKYNFDKAFIFEKSKLINFYVKLDFVTVEFRDNNQNYQNKNNFSKKDKIEEICEIETSAKTDSDKNSQNMNENRSVINSGVKKDKINYSGLKIIKLQGKYLKF